MVLVVDWIPEPKWEDHTPKSRRIRVSSKHLSVASPVYKALLQPHFQKGDTLAQNDTVEIKLPEDDGAAMLVVMAVLHSRHRSIPAVMTRNQLFHIASIVDKFDLLEPLEPLATIWIDLLNRGPE